LRTAVVAFVAFAVGVAVTCPRVQPFAYRFSVDRVIDGDTIDGDIDLGFSVHLDDQRLRLLRVNTPERKGSTRAAGDRAKAFTERWLANHANIVIRSRKRDRQHAERDSFGRYLVEVYGDDEGGRQECLNDSLLQSGNAVLFRESE
jgi:micrococcal nuclease